MHTTEIYSSIFRWNTCTYGVLFVENPLPDVESIYRETKIPFTDAAFPACDASLSRFEDAEIIEDCVSWRKASQLSSGSEDTPMSLFGTVPVWNQLIDTNLLETGGLAACFYALAGSITSIQNMISAPEDDGCGAYAVRLFVGGSPRYIIVDDLIPVDEDGLPISLYCEDAFWPMILEKALAKLCGHYHALSCISFGSSEIVDNHDLEENQLIPVIPGSMTVFDYLRDLTGVSSHAIPVDDSSNEFFVFISKVVERGDLVLVHWRDLTPEEKENKRSFPFDEGWGAINRAHFLRNRHPLVYVVPCTENRKFKGKWYSGSMIWEDLPKDKEALGISDANVGVWMEMDEIAKMSDKVLLGSDLFMEFPFTFEARSMNTGSSEDEREIQYFFETQSTTQIRVDLYGGDNRTDVGQDFKILSIPSDVSLQRVSISRNSFPCVSLDALSEGLLPGRYVIIPLFSNAFTRFRLVISSSHMIRISAFESEEENLISSRTKVLFTAENEAIPISKLVDAFALSGQFFAPDEISWAMKSLSISPESTFSLDFESFIRLLTSLYLPRSAQMEIIKRALCTVDVEENGFIESATLESYLRIQGLLNEEEIQVAIRNADQNGSGKIICDEFLNLLLV